MKKIAYFIAVSLFLISCGGGTNVKTADANAEADGTCCSKDDMKKIITAKKVIKADKVDAFIEFAEGLIEKSRAEEGNISYTLYQHPVDKTLFLFFEEWKNQAAVDFHFATDHFKESGERGAEFDAEPTVIKIYDVVDTE